MIKGSSCYLVNNEWSLNWILDRNPGIQFLTVPADVEKSEPELNKILKIIL